MSSYHCNDNAKPKREFKPLSILQVKNSDSKQPSVSGEKLDSAAASNTGTGMPINNIDASSKKVVNIIDQSVSNTVNFNKVSSMLKASDVPSDPRAELPKAGHSTRHKTPLVPTLKSNSRVPNVQIKAKVSQFNAPSLRPQFKQKQVFFPYVMPVIAPNADQAANALAQHQILPRSDEDAELPQFVEMHLEPNTIPTTAPPPPILEDSEEDEVDISQILRENLAKKCKQDTESKTVAKKHALDVYEDIAHGAKESDVVEPEDAIEKLETAKLPDLCNNATKLSDAGIEVEPPRKRKELLVENPRDNFFIIYVDEEDEVLIKRRKK
jgi:hypothetical protein